MNSFRDILLYELLKVKSTVLIYFNVLKYHRLKYHRDRRLDFIEIITQK